MGLLDKIKADAKKAGSNKGKFVFFREGAKSRIRFLVELDDGIEVTFHDSFEKGVNMPCGETFGRSCSLCDEEGLRTRSQYIWPVYDYDTNEVRLFMQPVNNCSPIPALVAMQENYGTIMDRDYVISVTGSRQNKAFSVIPMDKVKFRNEKAKPLTKSKMLAILDKAYPSDDVPDDDDEDEKPAKKSKASKAVVPDDDEDNEDDYGTMTALELYKLCKQRKLEALPRKPEKYYIRLLEEADAAEDDWGDEDEDDDDWDDE